MKKFTPNRLRSCLFDSVFELLNHKERYLYDPEKAFSRTQKISFFDTMLFPIVVAAKSTAVEMLRFFPQNDIPSQPALAYRRNQINVRAYQDLLMNFTSKIRGNKSFHGMRLVACDGTRLNTPYNPKDRESFVQCIDGRKGYNQYHINTCYDILNEVYLDAIIQGYSSMNEQKAFCDMMDRFPKDKETIFVADRGYSSYNVIAHAFRNNHHFVIRLNSLMAQNIFCDHKAAVSEKTFDIEGDIHIGRIYTKECKKLANYHRLTISKTYDYIPLGSKEIDRFHVRLVKLKLSEDNYEYLLTDLPQSVFSLHDLKNIYSSRWEIETSYRFLKYAAGLNHVHALKPELIFQEIYAKLIFYNFCTGVKQSLPAEKSADIKYEYEAEKSYLINVCIDYLKKQLVAITKVIKKRKVPKRTDSRKSSRNIRRQHAGTLQYR